MIDVHVLHLPSENKQWAQICADSLISPVINVHHINGINGDLYQSRKNGYTLGTSRYVSFVDPDDYVHAGAFESCLAALEQNNHKAVYTNSYLLDEHTGIIKKFFSENVKWSREFHCYDMIPVHQLMVFDREIVYRAFDLIDSLNLPIDSTADQVIVGYIASLTEFHFLGTVYGYTWRRHNRGIHATYNLTQRIATHKHVSQLLTGKSA
jgi:glycosyltransferase involved in cell wall biosynthesis